MNEVADQDLDSFISRGQQDHEDDKLDGWLHDRAPDIARHNLDLYKAGKLDLDKEHIELNSKIAQDGVGAWESLGRGIKYVFGNAIMASAPGHTSGAGAPESTLNQIGDMIVKGAKGVAAANEQLTQPEDDLAIDISQGHPIDALWNYGIKKYRAYEGLAQGGVRGVMGMAPLLGGATAEVVELAAEPFVSKDTSQKLNAKLNAGVYEAENLKNRAFDRIAELSKVSPEDPLYAFGENVAPLAVPAGGAESVAGKIEKVGEKIYDVGTRAAGQVIKGTGEGAKAVAPVVAAAELYKTGHPYIAAGELLGAYTGRAGGFGRAIAKIIDWPFDKVIATGKRLATIPDGETIIGAARRNMESEINRLKAQVEDMRTTSTPDKIDNAFKLGPDGQPIYRADELTGPARAARLAQDKISDLEAKWNGLAPYERLNRAYAAAAKTGIKVGLDAAVAGTIGGGIAAATESPGEYEQAQAGVAMGAAIGLAARAPRIPLMYRGEIRQFNRGDLIRSGETALSPNHAFYDAHQQAFGALPQPAKDYVSTYSGLAAAQGRNVVVLPAQAFAEAVGMKGEDAAKAPNGYYDPQSKTAYINSEALTGGPIPHEVSHALSEAGGLLDPNHPVRQAIDSMISDPSFQPTLDAARAEYTARMQKSDPNFKGLTPDQVKSEIIADLASDIMQKETPEGLFGGRSIPQKATALFRRFLSRNPIQTSDFGWPVTPELRDAVSDSLFQAGEKASRRMPAELSAQEGAAAPADVQSRQDAIDAIISMNKVKTEKAKGGVAKLVDSAIAAMRQAGQPIDTAKIIAATQQPISTGAVKQGEFAKPGYTAIEPAQQPPPLPAAAFEAQRQAAQPEIAQMLTKEEQVALHKAIDGGQIKTQEDFSNWIANRTQGQRGEMLKTVKVFQDNQKPFNVTFTKADGSVRTMRAQFGIQKDLKGGKKTTGGNPALYTVMELNEKGEPTEYRTFDLDRVQSIEGEGGKFDRQFMPAVDRGSASVVREEPDERGISSIHGQAGAADQSVPPEAQAHSLQDIRRRLGEWTIQDKAQRKQIAEALRAVEVPQGIASRDHAVRLINEYADKIENETPIDLLKARGETVYGLNKPSYEASNFAFQEARKAIQEATGITAETQRLYMPRSENPSDKITSQAIMIADIPFRGRTWKEAKEAAIKFGYKPEDVAKAQLGFVTQKGAFLSQDQASDFGTERGQFVQGTEEGPLRARQFKRERQFMPSEDIEGAWDNLEPKERFEKLRSMYPLEATLNTNKAFSNAARKTSAELKESGEWPSVERAMNKPPGQQFMPQGDTELITMGNGLTPEENKRYLEIKAKPEPTTQEADEFSALIDKMNAHTESEGEYRRANPGAFNFVPSGPSGLHPDFARDNPPEKYALTPAGKSAERIAPERFYAAKTFYGPEIIDRLTGERHTPDEELSISENVDAMNKENPPLPESWPNVSKEEVDAIVNPQPQKLNEFKMAEAKKWDAKANEINGQIESMVKYVRDSAHPPAGYKEVAWNVIAKESDLPEIERLRTEQRKAIAIYQRLATEAGTPDPLMLHNRTIDFMPKTDAPEHLRDISKELGLRFEGESLGGKALAFTDNKTNSTTDVPIDATPEVIREIIEASRKAFGKQFMPQTDSPEFKNWFGESKIKDDEGNPLPLYHGTTRTFKSFDPEKANIENDWGKAIYLSNTPEDIAANYAGLGPDLTNRIERRTEHIQDETRDHSPAQIQRQFNISLRDAKVVASTPKYGTAQYARRRNIMQEIAKREMTGHGGATMKVFAKMENPLELGGPKEEFWDVEYPTDKEGEITGEPTGKMIDFVEAIRNAASRYESADPITALEEFAYEGGKPSEIIDKLRNSDSFNMATDPETGDIATSQIIREAVEDMGYDGVIDRLVNKKFGSERQSGKSMEGMHEETVHYIAFEPTQIKSATGNRGSFDPKNPDIAFMPQGFYSQLEKTIASQPDKASPDQLRAAILKGPGVKQAELKETKDVLGTSFDQWLKENPRATKGDMLDFVRENQVQVKEVEKGRDVAVTGDDAVKQWWNDRTTGPSQQWENLTQTARDQVREQYADERGEPGNNFTTQISEQYVNRGFSQEEADHMAEELEQLPRVERNAAIERQGLNVTPEGWSFVGGGTKFSQYQLPGSIPGSYRETLATLPIREKPEDTSRWTTQERTVDGHREIRVLDESGSVLSIRKGFRGTPEQAIRDAADMRLGEREAKSAFTSSHWDEPNVVLHIRHNERNFDGPIASEGGAFGRGKMFFMEELQSDWAQKGRREGYKPNVPITELPEGWTIRKAPEKDWGGDHKYEALNERGEVVRFAPTPEQAKEAALYTLNESSSLVPDLPFKGNAWKTLGLKIALRKAVETGADSLGWTTGEMQNERYDLSKQVREIEWYFNDKKEGTKIVRITPNEGNVIELGINKDGIAGGVSGGRSGHGEFDGKHIADVIGKDIGKQIVDEPHGELTGEGLKIGGSGQKGFYDKELVNLANDLVKKWGVRVGETNISQSHDASANALQEWSATKVEGILKNGGEVYVDIPSRGGEELLRNVTDLNQFVESLAPEEQPRGFYLGDVQPETTVHSIPITEAMRKEITEKGFPLFQPQGDVKLPTTAKGASIRYVPLSSDRRRELVAP